MDALGKVIAVIFLIVFFLVAIPSLMRGEWIAPTALPPDSWIVAEAPQYASLAAPSSGYGWFRFDVWNNPPREGRPVTRGDFRL
ncbi:MAG TPA: hypothetical protein VG621_03605 [Candidatus Paceibacterota bacterium]|nr:hypothetical protein [Candidatus Paceibacterota bacterium]